MPVYCDADQLYNCLRALLTTLRETNPDAGKEIVAVRMVIRLTCTAPNATITLNGRRRPLETTYGPSALRPDLDVQMSGDTLHQILLDELSLKKAFAGGLMKLNGPFWKTFALAELFHQGQSIYPRILQKCGLAGR